MKITWKTFLAVSAYWAGVFGWFYIGVWQVLKKPVHSVILAQIAGTSFDRTFDRRTHTGIFVSVPGRWYLVCRLYDQ